MCIRDRTTATTIDRVSDALATSCTPASAKQTVYNGNAASWNVDIFNGGKANIGTAIKSSGNSSSSAVDTVHNCNDSPPTITLTAPSSCPSSGCTITATVTQGTHQLSDQMCIRDRDSSKASLFQARIELVFRWVLSVSEACLNPYMEGHYRGDQQK